MPTNQHALFPPRPFPSSPLPPLQPLSVVSDEPETAFPLIPLIPNGKHATVPQQHDYYCDAEIARLGRRLTRAAAIFNSNRLARPPPSARAQAGGRRFPLRRQLRREVHKAPTLLFLAGGRGAGRSRAALRLSSHTPTAPVTCPTQIHLRSLLPS